MKITAIQTSNFIGARAVDVQLTKPIALFAGSNGAGKSSLQEAVRMALTGESARVGLKKDYGAIVTEGRASGFVEIQGTDEGQDFTASILVPSGKGQHSTDEAVPFVLDGQRFSRLDPNDRRAFLFLLMGLKTDGKAVRERLLAKGCDAAKIEAVAPFLRAGFDAAQKEAQGKARECKASWKTITGGEAYGSVKAASWVAAKPEVNTAGLEQARADLATTENEIETETKRLGELQGRARQASETAGKLAELREKASMYARIADKLASDEAHLKGVEQKVAELKDLALSRDALPCPCCGVMLVRKDNALVEAAPLVVGTEDHVTALLEHERALKLMQSAVANCKRNLAEADAAARAMREIDNVEQPSGEEIRLLENKIADFKAHRDIMRANIRSSEEQVRQANDANDRTARAAALHQDVQQWETIAAALAPDGIPGEMLAEALEPINVRLATSANTTEWKCINIRNDMSIFAAGEVEQPRPYTMLSESEKWRADAMIAEAIAHLSGVRLLVLDRFDVLDLKGRGDLLYWLDHLAAVGEIDTALLFGTLKAVPTLTLETIDAFWIENGVVVNMRQAA